MSSMNDVRQSGTAPAGSSQAATLALLERLDGRLARLETVATRIERLEQAIPNTLAAATDTFDDVVDRLRSRGVDVDQRLHILMDVAERLTSPEALTALTTLLDKLPLIQHVLESGIVAEPAVDVVGRAGAALATAREEQTPGVGLWGAARAMSDADVKRALGFLLRVAQLFGRSLGEDVPRLPMTTTTTGDGR